MDTILYSKITKLDKKTEKINTAVKYNIVPYDYEWVIGSLNVDGSETSSSSRIRSEYIRVVGSEIITLSGNEKCLGVHFYASLKEHISYTSWDDGNVCIVPEGTGFIRILIRKTTTNSTITTNDIRTQVARCTITTYANCDELMNASEKVGNAEEITPIVIEGLNFVNNATEYTTASNYNTAYFPVKKGRPYLISCGPSSAQSSDAYFRFVFTENIPANGVGGTQIESLQASNEQIVTIENVPSQDGYLSLSYSKSVASLATIYITRINGLFSDFANLKDYIKWRGYHTLQPSEFTQGSIYEGKLYPTNTSCIATKDFHEVVEGEKVIIFNDLDTVGAWNIRITWYDASKNYLSQEGYKRDSRWYIPDDCKYYKFSISHLANKSDSSAEPTTPSALLLHPIQIANSMQLDAGTTDCKRLNDAEYDEIENTGYGYLHGDFILGTLYNGGIISNRSNRGRIVSKNIFRFDRDVALIPDEGYRFGLYFYDDSEEYVGGNGGFQPEPYIIPEGQRFRIAIQKGESAPTVCADIVEYIRAIKVSTKTHEIISKVIGETNLRKTTITGLNCPSSTRTYETSSNYITDYYYVDAGVQYNIGITMEAAAYVRYVFSDEVPANGVDGELIKELLYSAEETGSFIYTPDQKGYLGIVYHNSGPNEQVITARGIFNTKEDKKIPHGLKKIEYTGEPINPVHYFAAEYMFKLSDEVQMTGSPDGKNRTRQGATVYGDYLFVAYNGAEMITVYDMRTGKKVNNMTLYDTYQDGTHCNNLNFGYEKYDENDFFPLLYISGNATVGTCLVYRITVTEGVFAATLVQTITLPPLVEGETLNRHTLVDPVNKYLYIEGHTVAETRPTSDACKHRFVRFPLPTLAE